MTEKELLKILHEGRNPGVIPHSLLSVWMEFMENKGVLILDPDVPEHADIILEDDVLAP